MQAQDTNSNKEKIAITDKDYNNNRIEMADQFRAEGKIYVVVAVVCIILTGIFAYIIVLDRKISKLEKMADNK